MRLNKALFAFFFDNIGTTSNQLSKVILISEALKCTEKRAPPANLDCRISNLTILDAVLQSRNNLGRLCVARIVDDRIDVQDIGQPLLVHLSGVFVSDVNGFDCF